MIPVVPCHALSLRSVLLSWALALAVWPLAWALPVLAQGLATAAVGGDWIGASIPWGQVPWALVNEPGIAFAASRSAVLSYWLPPLLLPLALAVALPLLWPTSGRWVAELALFHAALASAVLGLAWATPLGMVDGPGTGLVRFAGLPPRLVALGLPLLACIAAPLAFRRLGGRLWPAWGGPTRRRRLALVLVHGALPGAAWICGACLLGWSMSPAALAGVAAVLVGSLLAGFVLVPRAALRAELSIGPKTLLAIALVAVAVLPVALWAGASHGGRPLALLWGQPTLTNNIRPAMLRRQLTLPRAATGRPAR